jgi:putative membrane protein
MKRLALSLVVCLITLPVRAGDGEGAKQDFAQKAAVSNIFEIEAAKTEISQGRCGRR